MVSGTKGKMRLQLLKQSIPKGLPATRSIVNMATEYPNEVKVTIFHTTPKVNKEN